MKKSIACLFILGIILFSTPNVSANNFEKEFSEDATDCEEASAVDYEITGSTESAEQVFSDCMDDEIDKLDRDMEGI